MTYNTNNTAGSADPRDLYDNSYNLDMLLLGSMESYPDRLAKQRKSWRGIETDFETAQQQRSDTFTADKAQMQADFATAQDEKQTVFNQTQSEKQAEFDAMQNANTDAFNSEKVARQSDFDAFIAASGYQDLGVYTTGISLTLPNQYTTYNGKPYRVKSSALPLTTTTWAADSNKMVLLADDTLRQDLATGNGTMVKGAMLYAQTFADLSALSPPTGAKATTTEYHAGTGIGGGVYVYDGANWNPHLDKLNVLVRGAKPKQSYSDTMSNDKVLVDALLIEAGGNGTVHFPLPDGWSEAHYLINYHSFNWGRAWISADKGVVIHSQYTSDNEGQKPKLRNDVVFSEIVPGGQYDYLTERGANDYHRLASISSAMATAATRINDEAYRLSLTDGKPIKVSNLAAVGDPDRSSAGMSIVGDQVSWSNPASAGSAWQGVEFPLLEGAEYEMSAYCNSLTGSGTVYVGARHIGFGGANGYVTGVKITVGNNAVAIDNGGTATKTITLPTLDKIHTDFGSVRIGVRLNRDNQLIVLINGSPLPPIKMYLKATAAVFMCDQSARSDIRLKYALTRVRDSVAYTRPLRIQAVGDSITRGARTSNEWSRLLEAYAPNLPGVGRIEMTNSGISGVSLAGVITRLADYDFSNDDYTLVMLGTNDVQGAGKGGTSAYYSNLKTLADKIIAQGSRPIFGVFPKFDKKSRSGFGVDTQKSEYISYYQTIVQNRILSNGWGYADADRWIGKNYFGDYVGNISKSWLHDNIHPNSHGSIAVAGAFAEALSRDLSQPTKGCRVAYATLKSGVTAKLPRYYGEPIVCKKNGRISITGSISATGQTHLLSVPTWARPPARIDEDVLIYNDGSIRVASAFSGGKQINVSYSV